MNMNNDILNNDMLNNDMLNNIIKDLNNFYLQLQFNNEDLIIDNIINYFNNLQIKENIIINNLFDIILKDNKILFNRSRSKYILNEVYNNIINKITNFYEYVKFCKLIIQDKIYNLDKKNFDYYFNKLDSKKIKDKDNFIIILHNEYDYLINNNLYPLNNQYITLTNPNITDLKKDFEKDINFRKYPLIQTKFYNNNIIYSYICYFKASINFIINHHYFLKLNNINSDSFNIKNEIQKEIKNINNSNNPIIYGGNYHPYELLYKSNYLLWKYLNSKNLKIYKIINLFNMINNQLYSNNKIYNIGTPNIKYYPSNILFKLLSMLYEYFSFICVISKNNENKQIINQTLYNFYDFQYIFEIPINLFKIPYLKNDMLIEFQNKYYWYNYLLSFLPKNFNNLNLIISTIQNDPLVFNTFDNIFNLKLDFDNIKNLSLNNILFIKNNNIFYNYDYKIKINDDIYYLQSFIFIEFLSKNNMCFHNVYVKLFYNQNMEIIHKIRYDTEKIEYINDNFINYPYLKNESFIFNNDFINDYYYEYFDKNNNKQIEYYKICLVSYCKKDILFNQ